MGISRQSEIKGEKDWGLASVRAKEEELDFKFIDLHKLVLRVYCSNRAQ